MSDHEAKMFEAGVTRSVDEIVDMQPDYGLPERHTTKRGDTQLLAEIHIRGALRINGRDATRAEYVALFAEHYPAFDAERGWSEYQSGLLTAQRPKRSVDELLAALAALWDELPADEQCGHGAFEFWLQDAFRLNGTTPAHPLPREQIVALVTASETKRRDDNAARDARRKLLDAPLDAAGIGDRTSKATFEKKLLKLNPTADINALWTHYLDNCEHGGDHWSWSDDEGKWVNENAQGW